MKKGCFEEKMHCVGKTLWHSLASQTYFVLDLSTQVSSGSPWH